MDSPRHGTGELEGRVAVVTGAGRGIGRSIAIAFAAEGARVALIARSADQLDEAAGVIERAGGTAFAVPVDVTDQDAVRDAVCQVEASLGRIDVLVNNAGSCFAVGPLWQVDSEDVWLDVRTSLLGTISFSHAVLQGMTSRRRGRIINLASGAALHASPYLPGYAAAKAGVLSLTEGLAAALRGHGVAVFAIGPGAVPTGLIEHIYESSADEWFPPKAARKWTPPERAAELALLLASGKADGLSGRFLHVADDVEALARRAEEIREGDFHVLRLRT